MEKWLRAAPFTQKQETCRHHNTAVYMLMYHADHRISLLVSISLLNSRFTGEIKN